ncbi:hypothetical protein CYY_003273 [Polysphondylium violaceum]|uniref:Late endosomal/lysosomal adaptor and MAPK and MTOR activator 4 n=1 Tax=Polysphondylium violaceum TaxID=133409 RepID=A0A8J4Q000_9MYCE|nr:hypothetical protein CYY_003273 [Polysphondylium violaceum]
MSEQDILSNFKNSMTLDQDGEILSATGELQNKSKDFAKTILSMLHDVNFITTSSKQDFKRMSITFANEVYIITIVNNKIFVVVQ